MRASTRLGFVAGAMVLVSGVCGEARAHSPKTMKVDIDTAKGELLATDEGWKIEIKYKIELEDAPADEHVELVFLVKENDRLLRDAEGRAVRVVVPLEHPYKDKGGDRKYRGAFKARLPDGSFSDPDALSLTTRVVRCSDRVILARKVKSVSFSKPHLVEVYVGVGICH